MGAWKNISFERFVMLQQTLTITKTGTLEKAGYFIEWGKRQLRMGESILRLEERPHKSAHINEMSMYFEKGK